MANTVAANAAEEINLRMERIRMKGKGAHSVTWENLPKSADSGLIDEEVFLAEIGSEIHPMQDE